MGAKKHLQIAGQNIDMGGMLLGVVEKVEKHLQNCYTARSVADWSAVVRESDAAIVAGADSAPQVFGHLPFFSIVAFFLNCPQCENVPIHTHPASLCYFVVAGHFAGCIKGDQTRALLMLGSQHIVHIGDNNHLMERDSY